MQQPQQQGQIGRLLDIKTEEKVTFLARNDIFRQLDTAELHDIERSTTFATYAPGRVLYQPGEKGTTLFLLVSGVVHLYHLSTDGRKLITATPEPGTCFGEIALLGNDTHSSFAEVIKEARVGIISRLISSNWPPINHLSPPPYSKVQGSISHRSRYSLSTRPSRVSMHALPHFCYN